MRPTLLLYSLLFVLFSTSLSAQTAPGPWENPLTICTSSDGTTFGSARIFQDSSGVPSVIQLHDGTLVCAFQWFPAPLQSTGWDSVAVKFSYDNGNTWTFPVSVEISGMPGNMKRPFDPTLVETDSAGTIRMFFSSGMGTILTLDSTVGTYSAISTDGIHYTFEPNIRFEQPSVPVIDPAACIFKGTWHYTAPIGAPQDGAYHATSTDGLNYTQLSDIPSDNFHNWTGNLMVNDTNEMRFYGSLGMTWWSATSDGNSWSGYTATNVAGGDPSVVKLDDGSYIMIYVGEPGILGQEEEVESFDVLIYPNPFREYIKLVLPQNLEYSYRVYNLLGETVYTGNGTGETTIPSLEWAPGLYSVEITLTESSKIIRRSIIR